MRIMLLLLLALSRLSLADDAASIASLPPAEQKEYIHGVLTEIGWEKCFVVTLSPDDKPLCQVSNEPIVDGFYKILISDGFVRLVQNRSEWIAAMAHETSHVILGHETTFRLLLRKRPFRIYPLNDSDEETSFEANIVERQEMEADRFAMDFMAAHGYNPCAHLDLLLRMAGGLRFTQKEERALAKRIEPLEAACYAAP